MSSSDRDPSDRPANKAGASSVLNALRLAATAQIGVARQSKGWKLVLRGKEAAPAGLEPTAPAPQKTAPASMREALSQLLDDAAGSRRVLRQLCAIEHALTHKDPKGLFLFDTPLQHLAPALRQLDALATPTPPPAIAPLRKLIVDAMARQKTQQHLIDNNALLSSFMDSQKIEVSDARLSDFDRAFGDAPAPPSPHKPDRS